MWSPSARPSRILNWAGAAVCASLALVAAGAAGGAAPEPNELVFPSSRAPDFHDEIYVLDTQTGVRRNLSRNPTADHHPATSPDGRLIAFVSDRGGRGEAVWRVSSDGRGLRRLHQPLEGSIESLAWSPDGRWLALHLSRFNKPGQTYVVPASGGSARRIASGSFDVTWLTARTLVIRAAAAVTARDLSGRKLWQRPPGLVADVSSRGEVALADAGRLDIVSERGAVRTTVLGVTQAQWSPDGSLLAYTGRSGGIRLLDQRNRVRVLARGLTLTGDWAPDGGSLLASDNDAFRPVSVALDGRVSPVRVNAGIWSRGGTQLLGVGERSRVSVWRPGSQPRSLTPPQRNEPCPAYYSEYEWLDDRSVVLEFGRGGQQDADLWVTGRSGGPLRRLRRGNDWVGAPEWAPDGSRIVYTAGPVLTHAGACSGPSTPHLRIVSADGSGDRTLVSDDNRHPHLQPRWSPDGSKVAYHRADLSDPQEYGVFVVDVASRALRRLTEGFGEGVSWAPDGKRLVFSGRGGIWIAELEHGTVTRIASGERPEWSPNGLQIAYVRAGELWTTSPDVTSARRLAPVKPLGDLRWSPDGSLLAFGVREGILLVGRDGAIRRRISQAGGRSPRFSRDGRTIAFVAPAGKLSRGSFNSSLTLRTELFLAGTTGGAVRRITRDYADVGAPSWR